MPETPEPLEIEPAWIGTDELPVHFANTFAITLGPNAIFLNLGSQVPPAIGSQDDLDRLRTIGYLPVSPIARVAISPQGLDDLIQGLQNARKQHKKLLQALEEEGPLR
jgi:hypothetical protein